MEHARAAEQSERGPRVDPDQDRKPDARAGRRPPMVVQTKTVVGAATDAAEREADAVADEVAAALAGGSPAGPAQTVTRIRRGSLRRATAAGAPDPSTSRVQRASQTSGSIPLEGGDVDASTERAISAARTGGRPLEGKIRRRMEHAFDADFSGVRVQVGAESDRLNAQLQAKAFTTGSDIFVRRSDFAPDTRDGQHLLAHELVHTVQQGASPHGGHVDRKIDERISAHDFAQSFARAGGVSVVQRQNEDPLAPSVPQAGQSAKFKHYLGQGQKSVAIGEAWARYNVTGDNHEFDDIPAGFVHLGRGMSAEVAAKFKMAVKELQRKLISALGGRIKAGIFKRDGIFGKSTEAAVKKFQQKNGLPVTGVCDLDTWAAIDNDVKAVSSRGREEFEWEEEHEEAQLGPGGVSGKFGMASAVDWAKKDDELVVSVAYQFERGPGVTDASVNIATTAIKKTWNTFNIAYKGPKDPKGKKRKPKNPLVKLTFNPVDAATPPPGAIAIKADQRVYLFNPPHPNAAKRGFSDPNDNANRSDAGNWNVQDPAVLEEIAGHEFGHAIGLEDEYGRRHKDMTRIAGKVVEYDSGDTATSVTWFKDKIAASQTFQDLKAIGDKTALIDAEARNVIAQKYRDDHGTTLPDDLLVAMTRIKTSYDVAANQAIADRDAKLPLYQTAFTAGENADAAATAAASAATRAASSYAKRPSVATMTTALGTLQSSTAAAKAAADLARPQHDDALTTSNSPNTDRKAAEDRNKKATSVAKASKRAVVKATAAATAAANAAPSVEAAAIGAVRTTKAEQEKTRDELTQTRSEESTKRELAEAALEAKLAAETAKELAIAIANRRAQVWGEIGVPSQSKLDLATAAQQASTLAEAEAQQAKQALVAARKAAALAGKLATSTSRTAPVGIAAGTASVAHATAEQSRSAAWDSSTQLLAQYVARDLAWRRNADSAVFSEWGPWTGSDTWKFAHKQGMSTGTLMGRGHGQNVKSSPHLDHTHPLAARHVRRYAEFVMRYKPDDVWEPVHR